MSPPRAPPAKHRHRHSHSDRNLSYTLDPWPQFPPHKLPSHLPLGGGRGVFTCALRRPVPQEPQPPLHPRRRRRRRRRRSTRRHRRHFLPRALIPLVPFPFPVPVPAPVPLAALVFLARRPGPPQARQQPPQVLVRRAGQRELALQPRPLRLSCVCVFVCVCVCVCYKLQPRPLRLRALPAFLPPSWVSRFSFAPSPPLPP